MSLKTRLALAVALGLLVSAARADAVCNNVSSVCTFAQFSSCCSGNTCTIDHPITVSGPSCDLNLGTRTLLIKGSNGKLQAGSSTLTVEAGSVHIQAPGQLTARGSSAAPGGTVTLNIDTAASGAAAAFTLDSGNGATIDMSGGGAHAGTLKIFADGAVNLMTGNVTANALGATTNGGTISIETTKGPIAIATNVFVQSKTSTGNTAAGGTLHIRCTGASCDLGISKEIHLEGDAGGGGLLDVDVAGKVTFSGLSMVFASAFDGNGGDGGTVDVSAAAIDALGVMQADGGGPTASGGLGGPGGSISLLARTGRLSIQHGTTGLSIDGANINDGGELILETQGSATAAAPTNGLIDLSAPISLQGAAGGGSGGTLDVLARGDITVQQAIIMNGTGGGFGDITFNAVRDMAVNNNITSLDPGGGGSFTIGDFIEPRDITFNGNILMSATASGIDAGGDGGEISLTAGRDIKLLGQKQITADGSLTLDGGTVDVTAGRDINLAAGSILSANGGGGSEGVGSPGAGGLITMVAGDDPELPGDSDHTGNLTAAGIIRATGTGAGVPGGVIQLQACTINVPAGSQIDSRGPGGALNQFIVRNALTGTGQVLTTTLNQLTIRAGAVPGGAPTPAFVKDERPPCTAPNTPANCLVPCPTCGDTHVDFPETCDDGNSNNCDSCSDLCRAVACNDGNPCTGVETCSLDVCTNPPDVTCGANQECDPDTGMCIQRCSSNAQCNDSNACNGVETCVAGRCQPGTPLVCAPDANPCTDDICDPQVGCSHPAIPDCIPCPNGPGDCDDNNACTTNECSPEHRCVFTPIPNCCVTPDDCDDLNVCTTDGCNIVAPDPTGVCTHDPNSDPCGDACQPGVCGGGNCNLGPPVVCQPDSDPCTNDQCDPERGCVHDPVPDCCAVANDPRCDDQDQCTADTCDTALLRCGHSPISPCNLCTSDTDCDPLGRCGTSMCGPGGACIPSTPPNCDDGDPRTQDTCQLDANGAPVCRNQCLTQEACDDGDLCTVDECDAEQSCKNTPVTGFATVDCRLQTIASLIDGANDQQLTAKLWTKLKKILGAAQTKLQKATSKGLTKKAKKPLKMVGTQLKKLETAVNKGSRHDQISADLVDSIMGAAQGGLDAVTTLKAQLTT